LNNKLNNFYLFFKSQVQLIIIITISHQQACETWFATAKTVAQFNITQNEEM
jgi:hypothetical protein